AGVTGDTGPAGATGETGPSGVSDIEIVETNIEVTLPPGSSQATSATCPAGYVVIGGGFAGSPGVTQAYQSYPRSSVTGQAANQWRVAAVNPSGATVTGGIGAYAICVS
ncbi:MAG: hypothetical protein M3Y45_04730, partial [Actinomycetota bacterium]|nr:hypothetical protein [Actinomycetota bacterium]